MAAIWEPLGASGDIGEPLGCNVDPLGSILGPFGSHLGAIGDHLGVSGAHLGVPWDAKMKPKIE